MGRFQQWKSLFLVEKPQYLGFYWNTIWNIENPNMPSDRARLVTPGTGLERLEHLPERIWDGFNNGNPCFPWKTRSIWGFIGIPFRISKIRTCHRIELVFLHLEPSWNAWNTFLNEYGTVLFEYGANFTYVKTCTFFCYWWLCFMEPVNIKWRLYITKGFLH